MWLARLGQPTLLAVALMLAAIPGPASAQELVTIRGVVRDSASGEPIAGVVVAVLDRTGTASRYALTASDGHFRIAKRESETVLRFRRIGFRPRNIQITPQVARDSSPVETALVRIPQVLSAVTVVSRTCPGDTDRSAAAELWEQARDGLLAAVVARDAKPADIDALLYERTRTARGDTIVHHRLQSRSYRTTRAFRASGPAAALAELGYVRSDSGGRTFHAPDAEVLLDPHFAETHCFRVVPGGPSRPNEIGLAFEPVRRRDKIVDVEGVLWLSRTGPSVRMLEFGYAGLDRASAAAGAGGLVEFQTMANGVVLITRWQLRIPVLASRAATTVQAPAEVARANSTWSVRREGAVVTSVQVVETGGLVTSADWPDGESWSQFAPTISGRVLEKESRRPKGHVLVTFRGASDTVTTDSEGRFALPTALPGRYQVLGIDTSFAGYVAARQIQHTSNLVADRAADVLLEFPDENEIVRRLCPQSELPGQSSALLGRIRTLDGSTLDGLRVRVTWDDDYKAIGGAIAIREARRVIDPDRQGRFFVCGVERERPISVVIVRGGRIRADTSVVVYDSLVKRLDVVLPGRPASLAGIVYSDGGHVPLAGAHVIVRELGLEMVTDSSGRFGNAELPSGRFAIEIRSVGFVSRQDTLHLTSGRTAIPTYVLERLSTLDPLTVTASVASTSPALRAFEERRRQGAGSFLGEEQLRAHDGQSLGTVVLQRMPGLRLVPTASGVALASTRTASGPTGRAFESTGQSGHCWVTVYRDGVLLYEGSQKGTTPPDVNRLEADEFVALEYHTVATLPPGFRSTSTGCGTLLLWSRERLR